MVEVQVERFAPFFIPTENRIFLTRQLTKFTKKGYDKV